MAEAKTTLAVVEAVEDTGKKSRKRVAGAAKRKRARGGGTVVEAKEETDKKSEEQAAGAAKRKRTSGGTAVDGAERLRQAADRQVAKISEELITLLWNHARQGHLASARTLMEWAGRKKPRAAPRKKPRGLTQAQRYEAEPQYKEPQEEGRAEVGGRRD